MKGHGGTYRRHRVRVRLSDGTEFVDRVVETRERYVVLEERGRIKRVDIRSLSLTGKEGRR